MSLHFDDRSISRHFLYIHPPQPKMTILTFSPCMDSISSAARFLSPITLEFLWNFDATIQSIFYGASLSRSLENCSSHSSFERLSCRWSSYVVALVFVKPGSQVYNLCDSALNDVVNVLPGVFRNPRGNPLSCHLAQCVQLNCCFEQGTLEVFIQSGVLEVS